MTFALTRRAGRRAEEWSPSAGISLPPITNHAAQPTHQNTAPGGAVDTGATRVAPLTHASPLRLSTARNGPLCPGLRARSAATIDY
jgi:hypothetical protein